MAKDFLSFLDYAPGEIDALLDLTEHLRHTYQNHQLPRALDGKSIALIWDAEGFRNRVAFELGIAAMGGMAIQVPGRLDERESIEDVATYLHNWFDAIIARTRSHRALQRLAEAARVPVINARTDYNHPCEVLSDLAFIRAQRSSLHGLRVAFFGEATNLCHSWFEAAARQPIHVIQCCPDGFRVAADTLTQLQREAVGTLTVTDDLETALRDAEVVYTDCWPRSAHEEERRHIETVFTPYQITAGRLCMASPNVLFLPCPPVHRGEEVSDDAMLAPSCRVYEAKEYLLHAQNALLMTLLS
jgi:ornithine carbamoyltransferase